jgi:hypothetical protein
MKIKTTKYSNEDIFELAYKFSDPEDAYSDLGSALVEKFPSNKYAKIYKKWENDEESMSSDYAYEALDDLIKQKTGVTLEKIEKYARYFDVTDLRSYQGKKIAYDHFFGKTKTKSKTKTPKKEECPPGKILNPATGRCVKRDGKIGKTLV